MASARLRYVERDRRRRRLRIVGGSLAVVAAVLACVAIWLSVDNPTIDGTTRGDDYSCLAPWDTVLNSADNRPGGEPPPDEDQIGERCRAAGEERFHIAVAAGVAAVVVAAVAFAAVPTGGIAKP